MTGGYLGVDMFFVVSGYLITGIIARGIENRDFSFGNFYARRAKRLLPSAYVVLIATCVSSYFLLSSIQYQELFAQLLGSVLFLANVVLWSQTGYFAESAYMKPLLHMWSLSIEEQYYLLVPLLLFIIPKRLWLPLIIVGSLLSIYLAAIFVTTKPSAVFFMLPTRFWELGIGSAAALAPASNWLCRFCRRSLIPALAILIALPLKSLALPHPGVSALLVCIATAIVILSASETIESHSITRALARVGDYSYSLYLIHFPLFAMARVLNMSSDLPAWMGCGIIATSLALGFALYRWVELPVRYSTVPNRKIVLYLAASGIATILVGATLKSAKEPPNRFAEILRPNKGLGCQTAEGIGHLYDRSCSESANPNILIWGDSLAAHLVPAITSTSDQAVAQASHGMCAPIQGMTAIQSQNEAGFAESCIRYNSSVLEYLKEPGSAQVIVFTASFLRFYENDPSLVILKGNRFQLVEMDEHLVKRAAVQTIRRVQALGKRVVIVSPPPQARYDIGRCWERITQGVPNAGPHANCRLERSEINPHQGKVFAMLEVVATVAGVPLIRLDERLCTKETCKTMFGHMPLYRDETHLSDLGSAVVGKELMLGSTIWRDAR